MNVLCICTIVATCVAIFSALPSWTNREAITAVMAGTFSLFYFLVQRICENRTECAQQITRAIEERTIFIVAKEKDDLTDELRDLLRSIEHRSDNNSTTLREES